MIGKHKLQAWAAGSVLLVLLREIYAVADVSTGRADRDEAYAGGAQGFIGVAVSGSGEEERVHFLGTEIC